MIPPIGKRSLSEQIKVSFERPRYISTEATTSRDIGLAIRHDNEARKYDIAFEKLLMEPLPVEAYENKDRYTCSEVWAQKPYYRTPRYLLITDPFSARMLATNLLNCSCIRFYADDGYMRTEGDDLFDYPYTRLKNVIAKHGSDIVYFPHDRDFKTAEKSIKNTFPNIGFIVCANGMDYREKPNKYKQIAEQIRKEGYFATTWFEILDHQEYVSHVTAHALGENGIENLRRQYVL